MKRKMIAVVLVTCAVLVTACGDSDREKAQEAFKQPVTEIAKDAVEKNTEKSGNSHDETICDSIMSAVNIAIANEKLTGSFTVEFTNGTTKVSGGADAATGDRIVKSLMDSFGVASPEDLYTTTAGALNSQNASGHGIKAEVAVNDSVPVITVSCLGDSAISVTNAERGRRKIR